MNIIKSEDEERVRKEINLRTFVRTCGCCKYGDYYYGESRCMHPDHTYLGIMFNEVCDDWEKYKVKL